MQTDTRRNAHSEEFQFVADRTTIMKTFYAVLILLLSGLLYGTRAHAWETTPAANLRVRDANGKWTMPLYSEKTKKGTVLLFVTPDCPISNAYAPEVERIIKQYTPKGFAFYLVYADPDVTAKAVRKHVRDYGYTCPALLDSKHLLVKKTGATTTPEVVLAAPDGKLYYKGRIDNRYVAFGTARNAPTSHDLRDALDAVAQNKSVSHSSTPVIGCYIPRLN